VSLYRSASSSHARLGIKRDALDERPHVRPRRDAALRVHRPVRAAQAEVHLQDAPGGAGPEEQIRVGRAVQEAEQGE
jgi:hypothetical protein